MSDLYLVVERQNNSSVTSKSNNANSSLPISTYKEEPVRRVVLPKNNINFGFETASNLCHSRSLPSLAHDAISLPLKTNESRAPPIPPRMDLFSRNNSPCQQHFVRCLAPNRSMNSLLFEVESKPLVSTFEPTFVNKATFTPTTVNNFFSNSSTKLPKKLPSQPSVKNSSVNETLRNLNNDGKSDTLESITRILSFEPPLATSSPIPQSFTPLPPTQTLITGLPSHISVSMSSSSNGISTLSSLIPQSVAPSLKKMNKFVLSHSESTSSTKVPPPVAPKPKVVSVFHF